MGTYRVSLLKVDANSNPEKHESVIEADSKKAAETRAQEMLDNPGGLGWASYKDDALWGQVQRTIVGVTEEK